MFDLEDNRSFEEIGVQLVKEGSLTLDYMILSFLSAIIASFGLLLNSSAIIIGAMILAPLMTPILSLSFSGLIYRRDLMIRSVIAIVVGIFIACSTSFVIGIIFSGVGLTSEILARTKPNIMDLFVALAAGFLGGYVMIRKPLAESMPGVAISISLMPPLCVTGIGLAVGEPNVFVGASLLFVTNLACIVLSGLLAFLLVDFKYLDKKFKVFTWPGLVSLLLAVPLFFNFWTLTEEGRLRREVTHLLRDKTYTFQDVDIDNLQIDLYQKPILVTVTVNTTQPDFTPKQIRQVKQYLTRSIGRPVSLVVNISPIIRMTDADEEPVSMPMVESTLAR
ncbi:MAG: DUF389 domain-containing protein [Candidatus Melainabacteria bacterium]